MSPNVKPKKFEFGVALLRRGKRDKIIRTTKNFD